MYACIVKRLRNYSNAAAVPDTLNDIPAPPPTPPTGPPPVVDSPVGMVRTQIYLTRAEHGFIAAEAARRGEPMAAVIRGYIDDKMRLPDSAWALNPMLDPTPEDSRLELPEDAAINHDHYLYGAPKKYVKKRGQWILSNPETGG